LRSADDQYPFHGPILPFSPSQLLQNAGDEGGIICHIGGSEDREGLVVSLTQVRVLTSMPLAAAVVYHNHRVKKLKERGRALK
jgi:hypothetical protein